MPYVTQAGLGTCSHPGRPEPYAIDPPRPEPYAIDPALYLTSPPGLNPVTEDAPKPHGVRLPPPPPSFCLGPCLLAHIYTREKVIPHKLHAAAVLGGGPLADNAGRQGGRGGVGVSTGRHAVREGEGAKQTGMQRGAGGW